jgi:aldose 1-epimerase
MKVRLFGKASPGQEAQLFTLASESTEVAITNYGGVIVSIRVPDRSGKIADVVLGYDDFEGYLRDKANFGGIIGRYANRIARGEFALNGRAYALARNDGENHLHGGIKGFDKVFWRAKDVSSPAGDALLLEYLSNDGEEGYSGNLAVQVVYSLNKEDGLKIEYTATTDRETVVNFTNHSYFNLTGRAQVDVLQHELLLNASRFTPVNSALIPTGELRDVTGTPFDFRKMTAIGERIAAADPQLNFGQGYDLNWVLDGDAGAPIPLAARVHEPSTGRTLEVRTTEPAIQFYSGNMLDGVTRGKGGQVYFPRHGFCLETQHFPDSPNHPAFPSTVLKPGERFHSTTVFRFGAQ